MDLKRLPVPQNDNDAIRQAGLEIEFTGMKLAEAAEHIQYCYGGEIKQLQRYEYQILDTSLGDFRVELDAQLLKKMAKRDYLRRFNIDPEDVKIGEALDEVENIIDKLAMAVVPLEIVMPPVPYQRIPELEMLRARLQQYRAEGTDVSWMHAFGLHINIELPNMRVETLTRYLRAFLVLYEWLEVAHNVDLTRRLAPFIDPFPSSYTKKVVDPSYKPDKDQFIADYLEDNDTRNRPLDMTPVLAEMDLKKVRNALGDQKLRPRPALHYRLPDCDIEDPDWRLTTEWNRWVEVERLVHDGKRLIRLSEIYLGRYLNRLLPYGDAWVEELQKELHEVD